MKVTVVGAGAVGATCADNIARKQICDELVIVDIKEGFAEGKAMDLSQTAQIEGFDTKITGSTNYARFNDLQSFACMTILTIILIKIKHLYFLNFFFMICLLFKKKEEKIANVDYFEL